MTDRIKPQIEMDAADYKKFRAKCQEIPVRWVVEAMIQSILASNTIDLPEIIETLRGQVKRGERRIHGRPVGRRDSFKRNRKPRQQQGRG